MILEAKDYDMILHALYFFREYGMTSEDRDAAGALFTRMYDFDEKAKPLGTDGYDVRAVKVVLPEIKEVKVREESWGTH